MHDKFTERVRKVMYLARDRFRVVELPVGWRHIDGSRVQIGQATWRAARDVARIVAQGRKRRPATIAPNGR